MHVFEDFDASLCELLNEVARFAHLAAERLLFRDNESLKRCTRRELLEQALQTRALLEFSAADAIKELESLP